MKTIGMMVFRGAEVAVSEACRDQPAEEPNAVEDQQVVDRALLRDAENIAPERADVVESEVEAPEVEEHAYRKKCVR